MDKLPADQQAAIAKSSSDRLRQTLLTAGEEEATVSTMDRGALKEAAEKQRLQAPAEPSSLERELAIRRLELEFELEVKKMESERMRLEMERQKECELEMKLEMQKQQESEKLEHERREREAERQRAEREAERQSAEREKDRAIEMELMMEKAKLEMEHEFKMKQLEMSRAGSDDGEEVIEGEAVKGGGALCAGNAVALLVFGPVMP